jgi:hypothetical protein
MRSEFATALYQGYGDRLRVGDAMEAVLLRTAILVLECCWLDIAG